MANKVQLKKSSVAARVPVTADIDYGELALNYTDGKLYYKKSDGTTIDYFPSAGQTVSPSGVGASGTWGISISGSAGSVAWSGITSKPTTVSGYGITDAQPLLVSGTNIKTVNGNSLLGSGNIVVSATNADYATTAGSVSGLTLTSSANGINPDSVTQNQVGYNTSVSLFGQTDGGLYSSAYNSTWIHQIYGDFRTGQMAVRGKNSGTWQAWRYVLDSGNYNNYAPTLTGGNASGTWGISISGAAPWGNISGKPGWMRAASLIESHSNANDWRNSGFYENGGGGSNWPSTTWYNSVNVRHSNQGNYHGFQMAMSYYDNNFWFRSYQSSGTFQSWAYAISNQNIGSQSVAYAARSQRANGNMYIDDNYGCGIVGVYSSYRYQGVFAMGDAYKLPADGTTTGSLYGMAWAHPNAGGIAGNLSSHGLLLLQNGGFMCALSTDIRASGNVTAYSDERLKTNWRNMPENYVARLAKVKVGIYDRIDCNQITQVGVGAQSFRQLLPESISTANDDMQTLSVNYGGAALASTVELAKDNVELRGRIEKLEALIEKIIGDNK